MRRLWLIAAIALATPASASAAPLGEVAPLNLRGDSDCVRTTGTPGELVTRTDDGMRFIVATRAGLQRGPEVKLPGNSECGPVETRPNGAGVIVGASGSSLNAVIRDPGGAWGEPVEIATYEQNTFPQEIQAAVSDRGDVIVAWKESSLSDQGSTARLRVARRVAGARFTPPEQIGADSERVGGVLPGIAATGEAIILTTAIQGAEPPFRVPVSVAIAPPGGPFGAAVHIADTRLLATPTLDVAPDGRALVAVSDGTSIVVSERAPGAGFAPAVAVGSAVDAFTLVDASLRDDGAAAVAWRRAVAGDAQVVTRAAPGAFSAPVVLVSGQSIIPDDYDQFYFSESFFASFFSGLTPVFFAGISDLDQLTLTPDGRAAMVVGDAVGPKLATVALAGGAPTLAAGRKLFAADSEGLALTLADGTPTFVWAEDLDGESPVNRAERYRIRLAAEGLSTPTDPPAPRVTIGKPLSRDLAAGDPLRLPVTCSAACEVRVVADSASGSLRLTKAGRGVLRVFAPGTGVVKLRVATGAAGRAVPADADAHRTDQRRRRPPDAAQRARASRGRPNQGHVRESATPRSSRRSTSPARTPAAGTASRW